MSVGLLALASRTSGGVQSSVLSVWLAKVCCCKPLLCWPCKKLTSLSFASQPLQRRRFRWILLTLVFGSLVAQLQRGMQRGLRDLHSYMEQRARTERRLSMLLPLALTFEQVLRRRSYGSRLQQRRVSPMSSPVSSPRMERIAEEPSIHIPDDWPSFEAGLANIEGSADALAMSSE